MHSYSKDFNHTAYIHVILAVISLALYWALSRAVTFVDFTISPLMTLTIFWIVEYVFDHWAWRILCAIKVLHVDNFAGTYDGKILAGDPSTEHAATYHIKQTWSRIEIDFESGGASSKSVSAAVIKDRLQAGQVELFYNYYTQAKKIGGAVVLPAHYGTAMLKLNDRGNELEGDYFTEQDRNSFGAVSMRRVPSKRMGLGTIFGLLLLLGLLAAMAWYASSRFV